jgi:hypothetical protein
MPNTYSDQTGLNTRKAIPTSRLGTRNLVWYSFLISYDLLNGEAPDGYIPYNASNSFYHFIVEGIQEAGELYHLGAPTPLTNDGFVFAIADNDNKDEDNGGSYTIGYDSNDPTKSSVYQAITARFGGNTSGWNLNPCGDIGLGIIIL